MRTWTGLLLRFTSNPSTLPLTESYRQMPKRFCQPGVISAAKTPVNVNVEPGRACVRMLRFSEPRDAPEYRRAGTLPTVLRPASDWLTNVVNVERGGVNGPRP